MTKIVGTQDRSEFILNPAEAFRRGEKLDAMLKPTLPPTLRGIFRGTHAQLNRMDAQRTLQIAKRLNIAK
jgi:hypothetical protein